jgi:Cof subfamily protein (haloacid dehalogenase superfamily)
MLYTKEQIYSNPNYRREYFEERNTTLRERQRATFKDINDIDEILKTDKVYKVLIIENDKEKNQKILNAVKDNENFKVAVSQKGFIDVNPKDASKGNALEVLLRAYGVTKDEVVVFGDQDNDISMLELVSNSVSMENASPGAREASKYQTGSNEKSGVADWLNMNVIK